MDCARACTRWRRHLEGCPVPNGSDGTWVAVFIDDLQRSEELRAMPEEELRQATGYTLGQYGQLQEWRECRGCQPRPAEHGVLCDQCYTRLRTWFVGSRNLAWCWYWLAADLEPGQANQEDGKKKKRKRGKSDAPPAAVNLEAHELRESILAGLGGWLGTVCGQFRLDGPAWFRRRLVETRRRTGPEPPPGVPWRVVHEQRAPWAEMDWRAWLPQDAPLSPKDDTTEIQEACRYLAAWLDRICTVEDLAVSMWEQADRLYRQVRRVAPWEPQAQRMDGLVCPVCDREALVRWEGDEHLTCRRCGGLVPRKRYDIWSEAKEQEAERVAS